VPVPRDVATAKEVLLLPQIEPLSSAVVLPAEQYRDVVWPVHNRVTRDTVNAYDLANHQRDGMQFTSDLAN